MILNNIFYNQFKNLEYISKRNWFFWTIVVLFCLYSLIGSIAQGKYTYDGYHWGLVASNAKDLLDGKIPYKDFFVHYGIITLVFQSLALKIYNSIYSLICLSSILYVFSIINVLLILRKVSNINFSYLFLFVLFFFQPYSVYPWHTYFIYFFVTTGILLYFNKTFTSIFFYGFCIQLCFLSSESFKICSYIISISTILILYLENKKNFSKFARFAFSYFLGFAIPLIIFILLLKSNGIFSEWKLHNKIPEIFLGMSNSSLYEVTKNFAIRYLLNLKNFYSNSFYLFGFILNLFCVLFVIRFFIIKDLKNYNILLISIIALCLNYMLIFKFNSFRLFCGPIIGYIVYAYTLSNSKKFELKYLSILLIFFLSLLSNPFEKSEANRAFVYKTIKKESIKKNDIKYFQNMYFKKDVWIHFSKILEIKDIIKKDCKKINYFYNLTDDYFYYLLLNDDFKTKQKFPGYSETSLKVYHNLIFSSFDKSFYNNIKTNIERENLIFIRENLNHPLLEILEKKINIDKFYFIDLPYSFNQKKKRIYLPKNCII